MKIPSEVQEYIDRIIADTHVDWTTLEQTIDKMKSYSKDDRKSMEDYYDLKSYYYRVFTAYRILQQDLMILRNKLENL